MSDTVERIYTSDGNNDALTAAALMRLNDNSPYMAMAAMNGGMGGNMWNSPMSLFALPLMYGFLGGGWGGGFGNRGYGSTLAGADTAIGATTYAGVNNLSDLIRGLSSQMLDNHNTDLITDGVNRVQSQIGDQTVAMGAGFANIGQDIAGVRTSLLELGYQNQLANCQQTNTILLGNLNMLNIIQRGFTELGFQSERNACSVRETSTANTQKIVDVLNNHWSEEQLAEITRLRDELATLRQTTTLVAAINGLGATVKTSA